ncbi:MAG: hypothetical protein R3A51_07515 [Nannocystaceae bacterium]|nr:hypothetical protein [Myxococcales bacterium]
MTDQDDAPTGAAATEDDDLGLPGPRRRRRSPLISGAVILLGGYLLVSMFSDFRYWMRDDAPVKLGEAADFVRSGGLQEDHVDEYVVLRGTPDVHSAARYQLGERTVRLLRITEGDGSLFAAVPRVEGRPSDQYEGVYEGRMRRLADTRMLPWIEQYYADIGLSRIVTASASALDAALQGDGSLTSEDGTNLRLTPDDELSLVISQPDVRLQLGRKSFPRRALAREAVAALGVPFYEPEEQDNAKFYQFWARLPADARPAAKQQLNTGIELAPEGSDGAAHAAYGAVVLPASATFVVKVQDLQRSGDALEFPRTPAMPPAGFDLQGDALVPRAGDRVRVPLADVRSVMVKRPITVDPNGYIINVDERPASHRSAPLLWLSALLVVLLNLLSLGYHWRTRRS